MIGATSKLLWIWHELHAAGTLRATEEILGLHVAGDPPTSAPFPEGVATTISKLSSPLPPDHASRAIRRG